MDDVVPLPVGAVPWLDGHGVLRGDEADEDVAVGHTSRDDGEHRCNNNDKIT